jgi:hypothetical protein
MPKGVCTMALPMCCSARGGHSPGSPAPGIQSPKAFMLACAASEARAGFGRDSILTSALASLSMRLPKW